MVTMIRVLFINSCEASGIDQISNPTGLARALTPNNKDKALAIGVEAVSVSKALIRLLLAT